MYRKPEKVAVQLLKHGAPKAGLIHAYVISISKKFLLISFLAWIDLCLVGHAPDVE